MFPIRDHNPSGRRPYVTFGLIAINIAVFLLYWPQLDTDLAAMRFFDAWGLVPLKIMVGEGLHGLVTSMFLHGGWLHLGGNMLFLWIFGDNLEDEMGPAGFLAFYLAAGLAASALQIAADPLSRIPMVGASGAIAGVMGAYLLLFPRAKVDIFLFFVVFFRIIPVRAWLMLGLWFGIQLAGGLMMPTDQGGVAYWAHAGGFLAGLVLALPLWLARGGPAFWRRTDGHPPHPVADYPMSISRIPRAGRR